MQIELVTTRDGSHSLYRPDLDEQYHSAFGAIQESMHVFIKCGYDAIPTKKLQVFEVGFGTGLNALLSFLKAMEEQKEVKYFSIEKYPLSPELTNQLNYPSILEPGSSAIFENIHQSAWDVDIPIGQFVLHKIHGDILTSQIPSGNDLVYFDAFSPDKDPLLWSEEIFRKIYDSMNAGGVFVTYSAKGEVRRRLISCGFRVEKLTGPPGKIHILRAIK